LPEDVSSRMLATSGGGGPALQALHGIERALGGRDGGSSR